MLVGMHRHDGSAMLHPSQVMEIKSGGQVNEMLQSTAGVHQPDILRANLRLMYVWLIFEIPLHLRGCVTCVAAVMLGHREQEDKCLCCSAFVALPVPYPPQSTTTISSTAEIQGTSIAGSGSSSPDRVKPVHALQ